MAHLRKTCAHSPTLAGVEVALLLLLDTCEAVEDASFNTRVILVEVGRALIRPVTVGNTEGEGDLVDKN